MCCNWTREGKTWVLVGEKELKEKKNISSEGKPIGGKKVGMSCGGMFEKILFQDSSQCAFEEEALIESWNFADESKRKLIVAISHYKSADFIKSKQ